MLKEARDHTTALDQIARAATIADLRTLASKQIESDWTWTFWPTVVACAWLVLVAIFSVAIAHREDAETKKRKDPLLLQGPLELLLATVKRKKQLVTEADLQKFRATIHRVVGDEHEQVVPYVGWSADDPGRQSGRKSNNATGLVGLVIRTQTAVGQNAAPTAVHAQVNPGVVDADGFWRELSRTYGYTIEEARSRAPMRLSSLAITIIGRQGLVGVVYCDSSDRDFFDAELSNVAIDTSIATAKLIRSMSDNSP